MKPTKFTILSNVYEYIKEIFIQEGFFCTNDIKCSNELLIIFNTKKVNIDIDFSKFDIIFSNVELNSNREYT